MASRTLLKMKINPNLLPLRFLRNSTSGLTRPVNLIAKPEAPSLFFNKASTFRFMSAREMGTSRSSSLPRGSTGKNDERDDDVDVDVDEDFGDEIYFDDYKSMDEDFEHYENGDKFQFDDYEGIDDDDYEEEEPPKKKSYGKKK